MIPAILSLLVFAALVVWFAHSEAANDFKDITSGRKIEHVEQWVVRALCVVFFTACAGGAAWGLGFPMEITSLPFLLILGAALFSLVFRQRLNSLRGRHRHYLGTKAKYDRFFLRLVGLSAWIDDEDFYQDMYLVGSTLMRTVHRGGLYASITETILSLLAGSGYLITNT